MKVQAKAIHPPISEEERLQAVEELARLRLPVGKPEQLERESVPSPENLLPSAEDGQ